MVALFINPSNWEAEASGLLWVQGQLDLHSETQSQNIKTVSCHITGHIQKLQSLNGESHGESDSAQEGISLWLILNKIKLCLVNTLNC